MMEISPVAIAARTGSQPLVPISPASTNSYGTVRQSYAVTATTQANELAAIKMDAVPDKAASRPQTATGARLLAVAQAIKGATQVDSATGFHEIKEGALVDLTKALTTYFSDLESDAPIIGTETGALSPGELQSAVRSAIDAMTSGGGNGAFSLSLTATKTFTVEDNLSTTYATGAYKPTISVASTSTTIRTMTLGLSLSADGTLTAKYASDAKFADVGQATEQGSQGASATASPTEWFVGHFGPDSVRSNTPASKPIEGMQESEARTSSYAQGYQTEVIGPTDHGQTANVTLTNLDEVGLSSYGSHVAAADYAAQTALETLKAIVKAMTLGNVSNTALLFHAQVPTAISLSDPQQGTTVLYRRPDGTAGRFGLTRVDKTA